MLFIMLYRIPYAGGKVLLNIPGIKSSLGEIEWFRVLMLVLVPKVLGLK
jgi:hypothetical protein